MVGIHAVMVTDKERAKVIHMEGMVDHMEVITMTSRVAATYLPFKTMPGARQVDRSHP